MGRQENELGSLTSQPPLALSNVPASSPLSAYENDLQEAIRASLQEGHSQRLPEAVPTETLSHTQLLKALKENEKIATIRVRDLRQLVPSLREDIDEVGQAKNAEDLRQMTQSADKLIYWGEVAEACIQRFLTPISLTAVSNPLSEQVAITYRNRLIDMHFEEVDSDISRRLLHTILGDPTSTLLKTGDILRWLRHPLMLNNSANSPWGLVQFAGGPCGLLASLQSYIIMHLFFGKFDETRPVEEKWFTKKEHLRSVLTQSIALAITQATSEGKPYQVCWTYPGPLGEYEKYYSLNDLSSVGPTRPYQNDIAEKADLMGMLHIYSRAFDTVLELQEFIYSHLALLFCAPRVPGCLNLACSLVLSRGLDNINLEDFEGEKDRSLLGMFGQCNQELVNLMLVGKATSNLFDGDKVLGCESAPATNESQEIMFLRGVPHRSLVGYVSEMEALRYCEVGDYLKFPYYPIWVCGSSDHFTVVFGLNHSTARLSMDEYAGKVAEEVFHLVAGEEDESGILDAKHLAHLLEASGLRVTSELTTHALEHVVQEGQFILRSNFVSWFILFKDQSSKISGMTHVEKFRIKDVDDSSTQFHLFHYDGQVLVSDRLTVSSGPELKFLQLRLLGQGFATTDTQLGRILATRWSPPIEVRCCRTPQVNAALDGIRRDAS